MQTRCPILICNVDRENYDGADLENFLMHKVLPRRDLWMHEDGATAPRGIIVTGKIHSDSPPQLSALVIAALAEGRVPILAIDAGADAVMLHFGSLAEHRQGNKFYGRSLIRTGQSSSLFRGLPESFCVWTWQHQLQQLPNEFAALACGDRNNIVAMAHKSLPLRAIQFQPHTHGTLYGSEILANFLREECGCRIPLPLNYRGLGILSPARVLS